MEKAIFMPQLIIIGDVIAWHLPIAATFHTETRAVNQKGGSLSILSIKGTDVCAENLRLVTERSSVVAKIFFVFQGRPP